MRSLAATVFMGLVSTLILAQGPPPAAVRTDPVRMETTALVREVTGELRAVKRSSVAAEEAGRVAELDVEIGDRVEAGQIIAVVDSQILGTDEKRSVAAANAARAEADRLRAVRDLEQKDLDRVVRLSNSGGSNPTELDTARANLAAAEAALQKAIADAEAAEAELDIIRERLDNTRITAPFAGRVVGKSTEVGQWLGEGATVVEIVSLDQIDAWIDVPERFMLGLTDSGLELTIEIPALRSTFQTRDFVIISDTDPLSRAFPVRIRLDNADQQYTPGMSVVAKVPTGQRGERLTISRDAVRRNDAGAYVFYDAGGTAAIAPVEIEYGIGNRLVVKSPVLEAGTPTIVEGNERLAPGQPVQAIAAQSPPSQQPAEAGAENPEGA